ncbi:hypothetical protein F5Y16DRAFT_159720 [Xylariaceae sp. FL0255]|nr:hypothetical protein F5Y16DRAFT_159720 [Xylariaceae sp. FL0255]
MPSSQRPFFLSSFLAAFRQPAPSLSTAAQPNKPAGTTGSTTTSTRQLSSSSTSAQSSSQASSSTSTPGSVMSQLPLHSPRHPHHSIPIPGGGRRRGSDSSSEGFRDVLGADKWYIGGRTAGGEERFFKLGVVKRVRSQDRLSLDRLSL